MTRTKLLQATQWITAAAAEQPGDLADHVAQRLAVSRSSAQRLLRQLVQAQWLVREGRRGRPIYRPGLLRQVVQRYRLEGLDEATPWARDFCGHFTLAAPVHRMVQHVFSELLNNAIDHSEGQWVSVSVRQTPSQVQLLVSDDGRGLFDKLGEAFGLAEPARAMLELSKGKLTSAPARHTGRGLYFSARLADVFDLHANAVGFQRRAWDGEAWCPARALDRRGTSVYAAIALDTERTLESVLHAHSLSGAAARFERTVVPLRMLTAAQVGLESRAQARQAASRLAAFARAEMDFSGIACVGHSFADELFRVVVADHPSLELVPVGMSPAVAEMVAQVRAG
jgi:anti-sigma regulatory factor (Ser/Thr protein kinase)